MKATLIGLDGKDSGEIELPAVFDTPYRPEVIHKVYINVLSHSYQRQGRYPARWSALNLATLASALPVLQGPEEKASLGQARLQVLLA